MKPSPCLRQQRERFNVPRTQRAKVTLVQSRYLRLVQPFRDCHHGSVDKPNVGVRIAIAESTYSDIVFHHQILHARYAPA